MAEMAATENVDVADVELLDRVRTGEGAAVEQLWSIYNPQLLRLLRARRSASPEDVASQVWIEVSRSIDRFEGDGCAFRRWLFTIAGRRAVDEGRRAKRRAEVSTETLEDRPSDVLLEDSLEASAAVDRTLYLIRQLNPVAAEAVLLRVVYDMPVSDVAEIIGQTEANVRVLVHRGLARLRSILGHYYAAASSTPAPV